MCFITKFWLYNQDKQICIYLIIFTLSIQITPNPELNLKEFSITYFWRKNIVIEEMFKKIIFCVMLGTLWGCSKGSGEPEIPDTSQDQDPQPSESEYMYPYDVLALNLEWYNQTELKYDRNGALQSTNNINIEMELGLNGSPGYFILDRPYYSFFKSSLPTRLSTKNTETGEVQIVRPFCEDLLAYTGQRLWVTDRYAAVEFQEDLALRVDLFDFETEICTTLNFPDLTNGSARIFITGDVMIVDNGRHDEYGDPNETYQLQFWNLQTLEEYNTLNLQEDYSAFTVNENELYLFYSHGDGMKSYELYNLTTLEILSPRKDTEVIPPTIPFFFAKFQEDKMMYEIPAPQPSVLAKMPVIYSFDTNELDITDWFGLRQKFQDDYFDTTGELPYGFSFTDYEIDLETGAEIIGFRYTKNPSGNDDFEGGILFTNFYSTEYTHYYVDTVPDRIFVTF